MSQAGLLAAIVTALAVDLGDGAQYDLSAAGVVRRGRYAQPPRRPFVCVSSPDLVSEAGRRLGTYTRTATVDIVAWTSAAATDLDTRVTTAETLLDKMMGALETARNSGSGALRYPENFVINGCTLPGDADEIAGGGTAVACVLSVEMRYPRVTGISA